MEGLRAGSNQFCCTKREVMVGPAPFKYRRNTFTLRSAHTRTSESSCKPILDTGVFLVFFGVLLGIRELDVRVFQIWFSNCRIIFSSPIPNKRYTTFGRSSVLMSLTKILPDRFIQISWLNQSLISCVNVCSRKFRMLPFGM